MLELEIETEDGFCPVHFYCEPSEGGRPAVILYMDAPGIRPALHEMAARLARAGYAVFLPDLFYRTGPYKPIDAKKTFSDPALKAAHRQTHVVPLTTAKVMVDTAILLDVIATRPEVCPGPIGVVGYCMGGRFALIAAATFPHYVGAAASYHAGGLADDKPDSPHRLAPKIRASLYVAGAIEDPNFDEDQKGRLARALAAAGVDHVIETYPARHGWVPRDTAAHDPAQAERHWQTLVQFLDRTLAVTNEGVD